MKGGATTAHIPFVSKELYIIGPAAYCPLKERGPSLPSSTFMIRQTSWAIGNMWNNLRPISLTYARIALHLCLRLFMCRGTLLIFFLGCRLHRMPQLDEFVLASLQEMLHTHNPYVRTFKNAGSRIDGAEVPDVSLRILAERDTDPRRYNRPTADEIGVIMVGGEDIETCGRDIILRMRDGGLRRISEWHRSYAPLHYVLLFPQGQDGWSYDIPLVGHGFQDGVIVALKGDATPVLCLLATLLATHKDR